MIAITQLESRLKITNYNKSIYVLNRMDKKKRKRIEFLNVNKYGVDYENDELYRSTNDDE